MKKRVHWKTEQWDKLKRKIAMGLKKDIESLGPSNKFILYYLCIKNYEFRKIVFDGQKSRTLSWIPVLKIKNTD